jgi:hypothetical protein
LTRQQNSLWNHILYRIYIQIYMDTSKKRLGNPHGRFFLRHQRLPLPALLFSGAPPPVRWPSPPPRRARASPELRWSLARRQWPPSLSHRSSATAMALPHPDMACRTPISILSWNDIEADGGCRINNFEAPRSARSNSSSGSLRWVTHTFPVQCIPDNTITYTLQSPTCFWNIVDNKIGFRNIRLPLSLILQTAILLLWVATLVTHLLVRLHAAHLGRRRFQGLLTADFSEAGFGKMLWLPAKQLNGCTMSTFRTLRT